MSAHNRAPSRRLPFVMLGVAMPRRDDCGSHALLARDARPCGETRLAWCPAPSSRARGTIADPLAVERAADRLLSAAALAERRRRLAQPLTAALPEPCDTGCTRLRALASVCCRRSVSLASPCLSMRLAQRCRSRRGRTARKQSTASAFARWLFSQAGSIFPPLHHFHRGYRGCWHSLALLARRQTCHEHRMDSGKLSQLAEMGFVTLFQSLRTPETRLKPSRPVPRSSDSRYRTYIFRPDG